MQVYEGVPTELEYGEIQRLRRELASGILVLMFGKSKAAVAAPDERYSGVLSEQVLEARIGGVDARIPWKAVTACATSSTVVLLLMGQVCLPICRSFFAGEDQWRAACAIVEKSVPAAVPTGARPAIQWRTIVLWLALLVVIFLAWHFAQVPNARSR
jgi:hypothetical protein